LVDVLLAGLTLSIIGGVFGLNVATWNEYVIAWLGNILWIPFEAAFLSSTGTTPGKWLFNIRLSDSAGDRLPFSTCLGRAFAVVLKGEGIGIPIVTIFTHIAAYNTLKGQGRTSWDADYQIIVRHGEIGAGRMLGVIVILILILIGLGYSMK
jgi:uncharacterized RDD family membrane protein YckC